MAGQLTIDTLKASSGVLATQNGMTGIAKAWVAFTGSTGAITGGFNVSSITRNAAGSYVVNFTTAMTNANYTVATSSTVTTGNSLLSTSAFVAPSGAYTQPTTSSFVLGVTTPTTAIGNDPAVPVMATVFGA